MAKADAPDSKTLERRADETESEARMEQPIDRHQDPRSGVVARGRRIRMEGGGKYYGPGEVVRGEADVIAYLRGRGDLVSPERRVDERAGPRVLVEDAAAKGAREPR